MRLLTHDNNGKLVLQTFGYDNLPAYAILSHTWQTDNTKEVTFQDLEADVAKNKDGYSKIQFCEKQAAEDGLHYFWIDTCCIDKSNRAEVQDAIASMFRWYKRAAKCYVYLADVSIKSTWIQSFRESRWFTRGWTLQELLAPMSVEFFSEEGSLLGDKQSLEKHIHEITALPIPALRGEHLSQFNVNDRLSWTGTRETKLEEDLAYSLLGIFGVSIPLRYNEGRDKAFDRLQNEIDKHEKCIKDLYLTDPRDDKKRIEGTKGDLLEDSYRWIFTNSDFQQWHSDPQSRLLWIKGDPGKGKTMLLCGIINKLSESIAESHVMAYFFCQASEGRINNATAVLRGLIYSLAMQQPSLVLHVRKRYDHAGKQCFENLNAWISLSEMLINMLQDPCVSNFYLIIDALDECVVGLDQLLKFIVHASSVAPRVKWIISSRNWRSIEKDFDTAAQKVRLCLELNEKSVSDAVATYIQIKVQSLAKRNRYSDDVRKAVHQYLSINAKGTFLWVALVCQELHNISGWKAQTKLTSFPPGLNSLYKRMMDQIMESEDAELLKQILAVVSTVYRPITFDELASLVDMPDGVSGEHETLSEIIGLCGSFLTARKGIVYFLHQSAKDYLFENASDQIFPSGVGKIHHEIFLRSLNVMSETLRRDIYGLDAPGCLIEQVKPPEPDPLASSLYSCIYWVDHLYEWRCKISTEHVVEPQYDSPIDNFMRNKFLYWLEALALCRSMSVGLESVEKLRSILHMNANGSDLLKIVQDAHRFITYHKTTIENSPLQAYVSALMFSPSRSITRELFKHEEPKWARVCPVVRDKWSASVQTFGGHSREVTTVAFSPDGQRLVSGSSDKTVRIWDASTGTLQQTLEEHSGKVTAIAFSPDGQRLVSGSYDYTAQIWDTSTGALQQTLKEHKDWVTAVAFSPDGQRVASGSSDSTVLIWDANTGELRQTLKGHRHWVTAVVFSPDGQRLVSGSYDNTVRIWDTSTGALQETLKRYFGGVRAVAYSPDGQRLASGSSAGTVRVWDSSTGVLQQTLKGYFSGIKAVAFSLDGQRLEMDRGSLLLNGNRTDPTSDIINPTFEIFLAGYWIFVNGKRMLWLPPEAVHPGESFI